MLKNVDAHHALLVLLAIGIAGVNEYSNQTGSPLIVHGLSVAVLLGMLLAILKASPLGAPASGSSS